MISHRTIVFSSSYHCTFIIVPSCFHHRTILVFTIVPSRFHHRTIVFSPSYHRVFIIVPSPSGDHAQWIILMYLLYMRISTMDDCITQYCIWRYFDIIYQLFNFQLNHLNILYMSNISFYDSHVILEIEFSKTFMTVE